MNYYSSVNSHLVAKRPTFLKKGLSVNASFTSDNDERPLYREESIGMKSMRLFTMILLFIVIGIIAYINFNYFITVL